MISIQLIFMLYLIDCIFAIYQRTNLFNEIFKLPQKFNEDS